MAVKEKVLVDFQAEAAQFMRETTAAANHLKRQVDKMQRDTNAITRSMTGISKAATLVRSSIGIAAGSIAAFGVARTLGGLKDTNVQFDTLSASLETVTGSADLAAREFARLQEFAKRTPFTLDQSITAFTKMSNLGLDPGEKALRSYGNTASAMGKQLNDMIEAVADASVGEFERLKEFGIKASSEGDRVRLTFKGNTVEIGKNAEDIQRYLIGIGETDFAGAMERQMERLPGKLSTLEDSFAKAQRAIGDGGFNDALGGAAEKLAAFLDEQIESGRAAKIGEVLGESISIAADAGLELAKAFGPQLADGIHASARALGEFAKEENNVKGILEILKAANAVAGVVAAGAAGAGQLASDVINPRLMSANSSGFNTRGSLEKAAKRIEAEIEKKQAVIRARLANNQLQVPDLFGAAKAPSQNDFFEQLKNEAEAAEAFAVRREKLFSAAFSIEDQIRGNEPAKQSAAGSPVDKIDYEKIEQDFNNHLTNLIGAQRDAVEQLELATLEGAQRQAQAEQFGFQKRLDVFDRDLNEMLAVENLNQSQRNDLALQANATRAAMAQAHASEMVSIFQSEAQRIKDIEQQQADERLAAYERLYQGIENRTAASFEFQRQAIERQAAEFRQILGDDSLVDEWAARQQQLLGREESLATGGIGDGLRVYFEELNEEMKSSAQIAYDVAGDIRDALQSNISDGLYDVITGAGKASDALRSLGQVLLKSLINRAVGFGIDSLLGGLGGLFGGGKALGGPVDPSKFYLVGERGPELFRPQSAGKIEPLQSTGGQALASVAPLPSSAAGKQQPAVASQASSVKVVQNFGNVTFGSPAAYQEFIQAAAVDAVYAHAPNAMAANYEGNGVVRQLVREGV